MNTKKILKLAIVGHGFVGKATDWGFDINVEKFIVDPKLNTAITDLETFNPGIIFICVPTPMNQDGTQDSSIIENVIENLSVSYPEVIKVIKSTILPSVLDILLSYDKNIVYNPEFLREKHANEDFVNSDMIILGGDNELSQQVSYAYLHHSKCKTKNHIFTDIKSASLIKYAINTFLASKVIFFNELHSLYEKIEVNDSWKKIIDIISIDNRIGKSHMDVPGHDGRKGFGGACFPKDSIALVKFAQDNNIKLESLEKTIKINNEIRSAYNDLDPREKEQNVSFDDTL